MSNQLAPTANQGYQQRGFINISPFSSTTHRIIAEKAAEILNRPLGDFLEEVSRKDDATNLFQNFYLHAERFLFKRFPEVLKRSKHWPRTFGIYMGEFEPALSIEFPVDCLEVEPLLVPLAEFGVYFNQSEVHVLQYRGNANSHCDNSKPEGAIWSHCMMISFKNDPCSMGLKEVVELAQKRGVLGLTFAGYGNQLQIYSTKTSPIWPPPPPPEFDNFLAGICPDRILPVKHWYAWLWSIGKKREEPVLNLYEDILGAERVKELKRLAALEQWPLWFEVGQHLEQAIQNQKRLTKGTQEIITQWEEQIEKVKEAVKHGPAPSKPKKKTAPMTIGKAKAQKPAQPKARKAKK